MELKEGMDVRTTDGVIDRVIMDYKGKCNNLNCNCKHVSCRFNYYDEKDIVKASSNLIDLIEVGDYVNGDIVIVKYEFDELSDGVLPHVVTRSGKYIFEDDINSIVTKEQFSQMEYKVN